MSDQAKVKVADLVAALKGLEIFFYKTYVQGIEDILQVDKDNWNRPCTAQVYGEHPGGTSALINRFKVETIAIGVSHTTAYNFCDTVVKVISLMSHMNCD
jgi:hypothetical protein